MADPNAIASLPQPPATSAAGFSAENGAGGHMPPPPLAVNTSMGGFSVGSPTSAGVSRAAPEPVRACHTDHSAHSSEAETDSEQKNKRALYVGGLDPRVTEDVLKQIFETTGYGLDHI
jgi:hypothetical protein